MEPLWIRDYTYFLPEDRIAKYPLERRDAAKLLVAKGDSIIHANFSQLADFLRDNSTLFFNDTRVIPARLIFRKETGAAIEVLLLSPESPPQTQLNMASTHRCQWRCMIGNLKKWNEGLALSLRKDSIEIRAEVIDRQRGIVAFNWHPEDLTFAEVVESLGDTPLPPYIQRETNIDDKSRYQTVYAHHDGAVAAPTAGLHFTDEVIESLKKKGIKTDFVTLHVSAGTFLPVKSENALEHKMHEEQITISRENVINLLSGRHVVAVGTTSMRTLESLYWYGCLLGKDATSEFIIDQGLPYSEKPVPLAESLHNVLRRMGTRDTLEGRTSIFIRPGYTFQVCDTLITNFHQPGSTLLLLVAAFAGPDWKDIYNEALSREYRFLSYGDSSLIEP